jgi:hypothetical protein
MRAYFFIFLSAFALSIFSTKLAAKNNAPSPLSEYGQRRLTAEDNFQAIQSAVDNSILGQSPRPYGPTQNQYRVCIGDPKPVINLQSQFPPTAFQGHYGSCYAYAATSNAASAFNRAHQAFQTYSRDAHPLATSSLFSNHEPSEASATLNQIKLTEELRYALAMPNSDLASPYQLVSGGYTDVMSNLIVLGKLPLDRITELSLSDIVRFDHNVFTRLHNLTPNENITDDDIVELYREELQKIRNQKGLPPTSSDTISRAVQQWEVHHIGRAPPDSHRRINPIRTNSRPYYLTEFDANENHICHDSPIEQNFRKTIQQYLCAGLPIAASLPMAAVESSEDGGNSYKIHHDSNQKHEHHAMIITGIEEHVNPKTGQKEPYYIFRNSWAQGDNNTPHMSLARVPVRESCRLYNLHTFVTPTDKQTIERISAMSFAERRNGARPHWNQENVSIISSQNETKYLAEDTPRQHNQ